MTVNTDREVKIVGLGSPAPSRLLFAHSNAGENPEFMTLQVTAFVEERSKRKGSFELECLDFTE